MKTFLDKHIFIPPKQGVVPYFFLIFIVPIVMVLFPINSWDKILMLLLLVVFLKVYREGFVENIPKNFLFTMQVLIAMLFIFYNGTASLFIYIGWQFPMWPIKKETFKKYLIIYSSTLFLTSAYSLISHASDIYPKEWLWIFVGLGFSFLSPFAAYSIEKSNRKMYDLRMTNSRLSTLVRQNERERIARDLHDHLGQSYSTIALKAELARKLLAIDQEKAAKELNDIAQTSRENLNRVRIIVANLHEQTIASAMIDAARVLETSQIKMDSENEEQTNDWPLYIQYAVSSIVKEATTNIIRHSQATLATYTFKYEKNAYHIRIKDNGIGMQLEVKKTHGISGMRIRAEELNGQLEIVTDLGTLLIVRLPEEEFEYD